MTHAIIYENPLTGEIIGFKTCGHAGYAEKGSDIVCAAVSMLVINTINSVELFTDAVCDIHAEEEDAVISLTVTSKQSAETQVLLKSLKLGLSQVAADNPDYLSITIEEV